MTRSGRRIVRTVFALAATAALAAPTGAAAGGKKSDHPTGKSGGGKAQHQPAGTGGGRRIR